LLETSCIKVTNGGSSRRNTHRSLLRFEAQLLGVGEVVVPVLQSPLVWPQPPVSGGQFLLHKDRGRVLLNHPKELMN
jgi:hypothetical protein